jgi:hypothetical protein
LVEGHNEIARLPGQLGDHQVQKRATVRSRALAVDLPLPILHPARVVIDLRQPSALASPLFFSRTDIPPLLALCDHGSDSLIVPESAVGRG